tara:strand:- start:71312 stop:72940 length:1629 start_codon:yes stop_codon:yes gene_type:complete
MSIPEKYHLPLLILVCLCLFFPHLGVLYENIMEARNFNTAREMLHYNNWIFTTMNGEARYEKPPLPTWLTAISGAIFGLEKIWALRLPSAIITTVMTVGLYKLAGRFLFNKNQAFNSALILATSFYILFSGRNGTWDIFAHSFMVCGIYFLFRFFAEDSSIYRNAILSGVFIGLSFMSKGPVSHFALLLPFLIAYAFIYRFKGFKPKVLPLVVMIVVIAILSSWWAIAIYTLDTNSATAIADKEATAWANRNVRSFYYYWSFFTQSGIWTIPAFVGLLYPYLKSRVENLKVYRFTLLWTLTAVVLLSLIPEKKSRYLLPVLIPLALNTSFYIDYLIRNFAAIRDKKESWPVYFNFGLIAVIAILVPVAGFVALGDSLNGLWFWFVLLSLATVIIGVTILFRLKRKNIASVFYLTIAFVCAVVVFGFPLIKASYTNKDYVLLAPKVEQLQESNTPQYLYDNGSPELIWDLGQRVPLIRSDKGLQIPVESQFAVWVDQDKIDAFNADFKAFKVDFQYKMDGNITSKQDRNYKSRRIAYLFFVKR